MMKNKGQFIVIGTAVVLVAVFIIVMFSAVAHYHDKPTVKPSMQSSFVLSQKPAHKDVFAPKAIYLQDLKENQVLTVSTNLKSVIILAVNDHENTVLSSKWLVKNNPKMVQVFLSPTVSMYSSLKPLKSGKSNLLIINKTTHKEYKIIINAS